MAEQEWKVDGEGNPILDTEGNPIPEEVGEEPTLEIDGEKVPLSEVKKWRGYKDKEETLTQREKDLQDKTDEAERKEREKAERLSPEAFKPKTEEELEQLIIEDPTAYHKYMRKEQAFGSRTRAIQEGTRLVNEQINSKGEAVKAKRKEIWDILKKNPSLFYADDPVGLAYGKIFTEGLGDHDKTIADKTRKEIEEERKVIGSTEIIIGEGQNKGLKVKLSAEERATAEKQGLSPEEYAKNKVNRPIE